MGSEGLTPRPQTQTVQFGRFGVWGLGFIVSGLGFRVRVEWACRVVLKISTSGLH